MNFFQLLLTPPDDNLLYVGRYDLLLVIISISVAILASYGALLVAQLDSESRIVARRSWAPIGGICMGFGIWSMHFIGMMAFTLPCAVNYDPYITLLYMLPGMLASTLALYVISRESISFPQLLGGGVLFGAGIGAMHYSGMAAMRIEGLIQYDAWLFLVSIVVAVVMAVLALWIKFRLQRHSQQAEGATKALIIGSIVMGLAVSAMHYTAMTATYFVREGENTALRPTVSEVFAAITRALPMN